MTEDERMDIALFRYTVIRPLLAEARVSTSGVIHGYAQPRLPRKGKATVYLQ